MKDVTDSTTAPRVFLSHSSLDKADFVEPLAVALRINGIDAWLDKWELKPGDSLIQRIINEAVASTDVLVAVVSSNSVGSKWVTLELDAGLIRRDRDGLRIIVVRLDSADLPLVLQPLLYINATRDKTGVEFAAKKIQSVVFNVDPRPALGTPPAYTRITPSVAGLTPADTVLLLETVRVALRRDLNLEYLDWGQVKDGASAAGLGTSDIIEARDTLDRLGLIAVIGHDEVVYKYDLTLAGFLAGFPDVDPNAEEIRRRLIAILLDVDLEADEYFDRRGTALRLLTKERVIEAYLRQLQRDHQIDFITTTAGHKLVKVSPALRRELD